MRKLFDHIKPLIGSLAAFAKKRMGFHHPPRLFLKQDSKNSNKALGRTAFYDPQQESITLYITARHPKDILRSLAHELIHHTQNLRGDLSPEKIGQMSKNYAQDNDHMRNMEKEAYLQGNMCFRDWEDTIEDKDKILIKLAESKFLKENKTMTTKITKETLETMIREILLEQNKTNTTRQKSTQPVDQTVTIKAGEKETPEEKARRNRVSQMGILPFLKKKDEDELEEAEIEEKKKKDTTKLYGGAGADDAGTKYEAQKPKQKKSKKSKAKKFAMNQKPYDKATALDRKGNDGVPKKIKMKAIAEEKASMVDAEKALYEERFGNRNKKLFEHLIKNWTK